MFQLFIIDIHFHLTLKWVKDIILYKATLRNISGCNVTTTHLLFEVYFTQNDIIVLKMLHSMALNM